MKAGQERGRTAGAFLSIVVALALEVKWTSARGQAARRPRRTAGGDVIHIDGSSGEGGGQIVRTSLALSLVTGKPFSIERIRANRPRPGLMRQHLTAVQAAATVGQAEVAGAVVGSSALTFRPGAARAGRYEFAVGTAGSATLVLQTILPALLCAPGASSVRFEGGTHNPLAPPFDFIARTFVPLVRAMGPRVEVALERPGFYPAGGGRFTLEVEPAPLRRLDLLERGELRAVRGRALVANLNEAIARRELRVVEKELGWNPGVLSVEVVKEAAGPGNALVLELESEHVTEVVVGFGERGVRAEQVAARAVEEVQRYLAAGVPVGPHLADQLLVPMALVPGGSFRTLPLTEHTRTQLAIIKRFLPVEITAAEVAPDVWEVRVGK